MKRRLSLLLVALLLLTAIPGVAHADMGPKPSIDITFTGLEGKTYYACLLAPDNGGGNYFGVLTFKQSLKDGYSTDLTEAEQKLFLNYKDSDGFVPLYDVEDCSNNHHLSSGRLPPAEFKVLIYFPRTGNMVVSDQIYKNYAFSSYYRIDAARCGLTPESSGEMNLQMLNGYVYAGLFLSFIMRLTATLAIEIGIARAFQLREKRVLRLIVIVNIITQTLLTLTLSLIDFFNGSLSSLIIYVLLETGVFLIEGIIYSVRVNEISERQFKTGELWGVAWLSNTASFLVGVFLLAFPLDLIF